MNLFIILALILFVIIFIYYIATPIDSDWKREIENRMHDESLKYKTLSDDELINELKNQRWGIYHTIWHVINEREDPKFIPYLVKAFSYFNKEDTFYSWYHCAETIFLISKKNNIAIPKELEDSKLKHLTEVWNSTYERWLEIKKYETLSEQELIEKIQTKNWGHYSSIWEAVEKNGSQKLIPYLIEKLPLLNTESQYYDYKSCGKTIFILCKKHSIEPPKEIEISFFQDNYEMWKRQLNRNNLT